MIGLRNSLCLAVVVLCGLTLFAGPADAMARRISEADLAPHVEYLADDQLAGRSPGGPGETASTEYIAGELALAGVEPFGTDGWFQPVKIVEREPLSAELAFFRRGRPIAAGSPEMIAYGPAGATTLEDVPVFVVRRDMNPAIEFPDLANALVLVARQESEENNGIAAARALRRKLVDAGAGAVLVIADREPRERDIFYGLGTAEKDLVQEDGENIIQGAISQASVVAALAAARIDWDSLHKEVAERDFVGKWLRLRANVKVETRLTELSSHNVLGKVAGRDPDGNSLLFVAHWDHLGVCGQDGARDLICNGAIDNATGVAALIEIARAVADSPPDRDVFFLATTAEEIGFLGIEEFIESGPVALGGVIAAFNLDTLGVAPAGGPIALIGPKDSATRAGVENVIRRRRLAVAEDDYAEQFVDRQDGWLLSQAGVPTLMVNSGFGDPERMETFLSESYHKPDDDWTRLVNLDGAVQDARLHVEFARHFGSRKRYPVP